MFFGVDFLFRYKHAMHWQICVHVHIVQTHAEKYYAIIIIFNFRHFTDSCILRYDIYFVPDLNHANL